MIVSLIGGEEGWWVVVGYKALVTAVKLGIIMQI